MLCLLWKKNQNSFLSMIIAYSKLISDKTLSLIFADDASKLDDNVLKVEYDLTDWNQNNYDANVDVAANADFYKRLISEGSVPRIDYIQDKEIRRLNLFQKEFLQVTDT